MTAFLGIVFHKKSQIYHSHVYIELDEYYDYEYRQFLFNVKNSKRCNKEKMPTLIRTYKIHSLTIDEQTELTAKLEKITYNYVGRTIRRC
jgi:hypothetical protein